VEKKYIYRQKTVKEYEQYNGIAPLYDRMMSHVKYELWFSLIIKIASSFFHSKPAIFEIGGGTGTLGKLLSQEGFHYTGSDLSFQMCREAGKKGMCFICSDALYIPVKSTFDMVIFLYDGINYLHELSSYRRLFHEVYKIINKNGFFLFDITTLANSQNNFSDILDVEEYNDSSYIRHSYFNAANATQHNDFIIYIKDPQHNKLYTKTNENHVQKIVSVDDILSTIPDDLFMIQGIWNNFNFNKKYTEKSERIHFLLKKKS